MKTITIITPANIDVEYQLAGIGSRTAAFIIDFTIQMASILLFVAALYGVDTHILPNPLSDGTIVAIILVVSFVIHFGYFVVCELLMNGRTIGKKIFGLRVIQDNGMPIEFSHVMIRGLVRATLDMMYVGLFVVLFSKKHKRIGDMAAGTIVVIERYHHGFDLAMPANDIQLPATFPPMAEMTAEEREVVQAWLRRRHTLPDGGLKMEQQIVAHFTSKRGYGFGPRFL